MSTVLNLLSWVFCLIFAIVSLLVFGMGGRLQFILIFCIALILAPPIRQLIQQATTFEIPWWGFLIVGLALWVGVMLSFMLNPAESIYKSDHYKKELNELYDAKLAAWPVPYKSVFLDTPYGKVHVIASGNENNPAILLINASALAGWSWIHNVEELSKEYRTFAIDNIGEGSKNEMLTPGNIPESGEEIADFYSGICDQLGIQKAHLIGASIGGYISTNIALYAPERVNKLVLLGAMGYGSTGKTVIAMTLAQGFPVKPIQNATFKWAFGENETVSDSFREWFRLYMKGLVPTPIKPHTFTASQLEHLQVPTLAYFGTKDGVIGDAGAAKALARNIPGVEIKIVESGHVIGAELASRVNQEILEFLHHEGLD